MIKEVSCCDCEFAISNVGSDYSGYELRHFWHYTNMSAILEIAMGKHPPLFSQPPLYIGFLFFVTPPPLKARSFSEPPKY